ncbi:tetratricopeptide repeat protein [Novosphingobium sp.]|uniref:tetratricopeptide repeat protein n=1 Tax=Novosphingobium sp. TaxID=1874826 RepID=UPI00356147BB|nr:tetratricopeptide repeat protein [Novosphingobium sp.]
MTIKLRGRLPLVAIALGLTAPFTAPLMAQTAPKAATTQVDPEMRLRRIEAEIRAVQRKVFPEGVGKTFVPEITAGQSVTTPAGTPAAPAVSDLLARMDAVEAQLARFTAQIEEGQNRSAKMEERLAKLELAAAPPSAEPEVPVTTSSATPSATTVAPKPAVVAKPAAIAPVTAKPATAKPLTPSATRVAAVQAIEKPTDGDAGANEYMYGFRLWEAKFYPEAQQQLQIFVDRYPKHKMISLGRNLLGRAWLDDGKPGTAAQFFLQNYLADKKGTRAPDSLLYLGVAMVKLKDTEKACGAFSELAATYPSEVAGRIKTQYDNARASVKCK